MGQIRIETCEIEGLKIITPEVFGDARGFFMETFHVRQFAEAGIDMPFVQDNESASRGGVLRGLHFQKEYPQDKIVRVTRGEVFDVAVDLRDGSATFGKWHGVHLSEENKKEFYIPKGFAHGFYVVSDYAEFTYKCSDYYHPEDESGIAWDDPDIGITWPVPGGQTPQLSEKDTKWGSLKDFVAWRKDKGARHDLA